MEKLQEFKIYHNEYPDNWVAPSDLDFIYNRFDLFSDDFYIFLTSWGGEEYSFTGTVEGNRLNIGLWLVQVEKEFFVQLCNEIFSQMKDVHQIRYMHGLVQYGVQSYEYNHFKINLPKSGDELHSRLSSKHRYNLKREKNIIEKDLGGSVMFLEYGREQIPSDLVEAFFRFKKTTYQADYNMSPEQYLDTFHVTDAYVMTAPDCEDPLSIVFSCEQCGIVYIENLTYNPEYAKYSPGSVIYDYYLTRLIQKGKRMLYLSGGQFSYKKWYGSTEEKVYVGLVFRNKLKYLTYKMKLFTQAMKNKFVSAR